MDGFKPDVLSTDDVPYFEAQFFLVPPTGTIYKNPYLSVLRKRLVGSRVRHATALSCAGHVGSLGEPTRLTGVRRP